jgi:hypothetical protein
VKVVVEGERARGGESEGESEGERERERVSECAKGTVGTGRDGTVGFGKGREGSRRDGSGRAGKGRDGTGREHLHFCGGYFNNIIKGGE